MNKVEYDGGYWCDICHQKHYQLNPACYEERRRREQYGWPPRFKIPPEDMERIRQALEQAKAKP